MSDITSPSEADDDAIVGAGRQQLFLVRDDGSVVAMWDEE
jgi:hypothetical protein